jgi:hypothetical protein
VESRRLNTTTVGTGQYSKILRSLRSEKYRPTRRLGLGSRASMTRW